jgi:hypothetical protein
VAAPAAAKARGRRRPRPHQRPARRRGPEPGVAAVLLPLRRRHPASPPRRRARPYRKARRDMMCDVDAKNICSESEGTPHVLQYVPGAEKSSSRWRRSTAADRFRRRWPMWTAARSRREGAAAASLGPSGLVGARAGVLAASLCLLLLVVCYLQRLARRLALGELRSGAERGGKERIAGSRLLVVVEP